MKFCLKMCKLALTKTNGQTQKITTRIRFKTKNWQFFEFENVYFSPKLGENEEEKTVARFMSEHYESRFSYFFPINKILFKACSRQFGAKKVGCFFYDFLKNALLLK